MIKLCNCNQTMALDAKALAAALKLGSPVTIHTELCRREVGAFQEALQSGDCLVAFTQDGGRKIDAWTALHKTVIVPFDASGDDPRAFFNANTLAELQSLERP